MPAIALVEIGQTNKQKEKLHKLLRNISALKRDESLKGKSNLSKNLDSIHSNVFTK